MAAAVPGGGSGAAASGGAGKKPAKTSKLAKMNEQERAKYLERKMAEEEEVKRRKQAMVQKYMQVRVHLGFFSFSSPPVFLLGF